MIYLKNKIVFPFWVFLRTFHIHVYGGEKHKVWKCEIQFRWLIFLCCNWAYFQYFISLRSGLKLRFPHQKVLIVEEFSHFQIYPTIHISQESCALILFFKNSKIATWLDLKFLCSTWMLEIVACIKCLKFWWYMSFGINVIRIYVLEIR